MAHKFLIAVSALALMACLPGKTDAYGAAHFGYTRVTPYGVYHTGGTAVAGPYGGVYAGGRAMGYGYGGVYGGAYRYGYPNLYGAAAGYGVAGAYENAVLSHVYVPGYYGGYGYIR